MNNCYIGVGTKVLVYNDDSVELKDNHTKIDTELELENDIESLYDYKSKFRKKLIDKININRIFHKILSTFLFFTLTSLTILSILVNSIIVMPIYVGYFVFILESFVYIRYINKLKRNLNNGELYYNRLISNKSRELSNIDKNKKIQFSNLDEKIIVNTGGSKIKLEKLKKLKQELLKFKEDNNLDLISAWGNKKFMELQDSYINPINKRIVKQKGKC